MPSIFEYQFSTQAPSLRDFFGTPDVTYTGPDGVTIVSGLTVRVQRDEVRQIERSMRSSGEMQTADLTVLQADLPNPVKDGRFSFAGPVGPEVWTIETTPLAVNGEFVCKCVRVSTDRLMARRMRE